MFQTDVKGRVCVGIAGHFTQLVWAASRLLGVGLAKSATGRQSPTKQMVQSKSTTDTF